MLHDLRYCNLSSIWCKRARVRARRHDEYLAHNWSNICCCPTTGKESGDHVMPVGECRSIAYDRRRNAVDVSHYNRDLLRFVSEGGCIRGLGQVALDICLDASTDNSQLVHTQHTFVVVLPSQREDFVVVVNLAGLGFRARVRQHGDLISVVWYIPMRPLGSLPYSICVILTRSPPSSCFVND